MEVIGHFSGKGGKITPNFGARVTDNAQGFGRFRQRVAGCPLVFGRPLARHLGAWRRLRKSAQVRLGTQAHERRQVLRGYRGRLAGRAARWLLL